MKKIEVFNNLTLDINEKYCTVKTSNRFYGFVIYIFRGIKLLIFKEFKYENTNVNFNGF